MTNFGNAMLGGVPKMASRNLILMLRLGIHRFKSKIFDTQAEQL